MNQEQEATGPGIVALSSSLQVLHVNRRAMVLLTHGEYYMRLADLKSYGQTHERPGRFYARQNGWADKAVLSIASSGMFSSDRTIVEYAREIWGLTPCPVS